MNFDFVLRIELIVCGEFCIDIDIITVSLDKISSENLNG